MLGLAIAACSLYEYAHKEEETKSANTENNPQNNARIPPQTNSTEHIETKETEEDRINIFKLSLSSKPSARLKWGKDSAEAFRFLLHRKIASEGYKRVELTPTTLALHPRLDLTLTIRPPISLALHPTRAIWNHSDPVENTLRPIEPPGDQQEELPQK